MILRKIIFFIILLCQSTVFAAPPEWFELGMNTHGYRDDGLEHVKDAGITWVRAEQPWSDIEKEPGRFDWSWMDLMLRDHKRRGFKVLFILSGTPSFHSNNGDINGAPDTQAWMRYVDRVTERYKDYVDAWEVWNEPNLKQFWAGDARLYVNVILKPAYPIIKRNDPDSVVGAPGLANLYSAKFWEFLKKMNQYGAGPYFDVLTHHIYANETGGLKTMLIQSRLGKPSVLKARQDSRFDKKPFWITEYGCEELTHKGEAGQAKCIVDQTKILWTINWIEKAFIYSVIDDPRYEDKFKWGVLKSNESPKLAIPRIKQMMQQ